MATIIFDILFIIFGAWVYETENNKWARIVVMTLLVLWGADLAVDTMAWNENRK